MFAGIIDRFRILVHFCLVVVISIMFVLRNYINTNVESFNGKLFITFIFCDKLAFEALKIAHISTLSHSFLPPRLDKDTTPVSETQQSPFQAKSSPAWHHYDRISALSTCPTLVETTE